MRHSKAYLEDVYLLHAKEGGLPWYLVSEHGGVLLSGFTANDRSHYSYVLGYLAGVNSQTAIRKQLIEVDYIEEQLPEGVPEIVGQMYQRGAYFNVER